MSEAKKAIESGPNVFDKHKQEHEILEPRSINNQNILSRSLAVLRKRIFECTDPQISEDLQHKISVSRTRMKEIKTMENKLDKNIHLKKQKLIKSSVEFPATDGHLFEKTFIDQDTGLYNRAGLSRLDNLLKENKQVSIASIDLDHFKAYNLVYGNYFGDFVIKMLGLKLHTLISNNSDKDLNVVRMGGEEIIIFAACSNMQLQKIMNDVISEFKSEVLKKITPNERMGLERCIALTKLENNLDQASSEVGGTTVGVVTVESRLINNQEFRLSEIINLSSTQKNLIVLADEIMEKQKKSGKRGVVLGPIVEKNDKDGHTVEVELNPEQIALRTLDFVARSHLSNKQTSVIENLKTYLDKKVCNRFMSLIPKTDSLLETLSRQQKSLLATYLKDARIFTTEAENLATKLKIQGIDANLLKTLKYEYLNARYEIGSYTGASSPYKLQDAIENAGSGFKEKNVRTIEIGGFKSVNEVGGHTPGDTFISYVYQEVIKEAFEMSGINEKDAIFIQKGADFKYVFHERALDKEKLFRNYLYTLYQKKSKALDDDLGSDETPHYQHLVLKLRDKYQIALKQLENIDLAANLNKTYLDDLNRLETMYIAGNIPDNLIDFELNKGKYDVSYGENGNGSDSLANNIQRGSDRRTVPKGHNRRSTKIVKTLNQQRRDWIIKQRCDTPNEILDKIYHICIFDSSKKILN